MDEDIRTLKKKRESENIYNSGLIFHGTGLTVYSFKIVTQFDP